MHKSARTKGIGLHTSPPPHPAPHRGTYRLGRLCDGEGSLSVWGQGTTLFARTAPHRSTHGRWWWRDSGLIAPPPPNHLPPCCHAACGPRHHHPLVQRQPHSGSGRLLVGVCMATSRPVGAVAGGVEGCGPAPHSSLDWAQHPRGGCCLLLQCQASKWCVHLDLQSRRDWNGERSEFCAPVILRYFST